MKKPISIIFNDAHLKTGNEQEVIRSVKHMLKYAKTEGINNLIFAGDLFDSRSFQRQSVLQAFDEILELIHNAGCTLYIFAGNHDKTIYKSYDSFLDVYRHHPSVVFNREISVISLEDVTITLLPFFSDDMLIPMLEDAKGTDVLISHFEMAGSTHLGKTSVKSTINKELLSKFKKTYLGHYHNHHEISKDIVHLPSLRQSNFGEDDNKGFSVLFSDLSYEIVQGDFKKFKKIVIDIDSKETSELKELIKMYGDSSDTIRFEFIGKESSLKAIDKTMFTDRGIDVKIKYSVKYDFLDDNLTMPTIVEHYGEGQVKEAFKIFCEEKGYEHQEGAVLLNEFLKNK
jgi:DNA repair protein SbcD/Mre11